MYGTKKILNALFLLVVLAMAGGKASGQCGPAVPSFTCDLTGQPNGTYLSPACSRNDNCCGSTAPDRCVRFEVTLDPAAIGLVFDVCVGAVPPGALYYQINCGPPTPVGTGICVHPPYPIVITFCKPGNNQNQYCIRSIAPPSAAGLSKNCSAKLWAFGLDPSTITWTSISPGPIGAYDGYLSCKAGCDSTWVHPQSPWPSYIDYKVCGQPIAGCNSAYCDTIRITLPPALTTTVSPTNMVTCYGGHDGGGQAGPTSGGTPAYTYSWNPYSGSGSIVTGLGAGTYTSIATDAVGCTATSTMVITQPTPVIATYTTVAATCSQANGSATVYPSGGTPLYTFLWSNGGTTQTITGLSPGVYGVTITDAYGCTHTMNIAVSNVLPIVTVSSTSVSCNGGANGTGTSYASGGVPPYTYLWSPGGQTTSTATGLSAGTYTVVTSSQGCNNYQLVTVTEPALLTGTVTAQHDVSCYGGNDGYIHLSYSGGTPLYTFFWSNGQTGPNATGLSPGTYSIVVSDAHGCTATNTFTITQPATPLSAVPFSQTNATCFGTGTGTASVSASGGTPGYSYFWTGGQTGPNAYGLTAGNYTCTVTDANGCATTVTFTITQPPPITAAIAGSTTTFCGAGNVSLNGSATGGTPGYWYSWSPTGATTTSITDYVTSSTTYTLTVTDAFGCTKTTVQPVSVYPNPPATFSAPNTCLSNPTHFSSSSSGGTWAWTFGEPSSGSNNVSSIQNPQHIYASPGTYTVTLIVVSQYGCSDTASQTVVINPLPKVSFTSNTVCQGNTTTFNNTSTLAGGNLTGWSWNFADPNSGPNNISTSQNPTHIFTSAGTFNVILTATSDSGCQNSVTMPVVVYPVPTPSFLVSQACSNSPVNFTDASTYGTSWLWDFGNQGNLSTVQNPTYTYPSPGTYVVTFTVTSAGGCTTIASKTITVNPTPTANFAPDSVCVHTPSAFTDLSTAPGGTVTGWSWDFGDNSGGSNVQNPFHTYAYPGTYTVALTITSDKGCSATGTKTLIVFPGPTAAFGYAPGGCIEEGTEVDFTDQSYSNIKSWYWQFGDSVQGTPIRNPSHTYSDTGQYTVSLWVKDMHGCTDTARSSLCVEEWTFYMPTAFSPNGNHKNDFFFGKGIGITDYEFWIFDRWGNLIFHCHVHGLPQDPACRWDGSVQPGGPDLNGSSKKVVQEDVYVWKARMTNVLEDVHSYVGTVTMIK